MGGGWKRHMGNYYCPYCFCEYDEQKDCCGGPVRTKPEEQWDSKTILKA